MTTGQVWFRICVLKTGNMLTQLFTKLEYKKTDGNATKLLRNSMLEIFVCRWRRPQYVRNLPQAWYAIPPQNLIPASIIVLWTYRTIIPMSYGPLLFRSYVVVTNTAIWLGHSRYKSHRPPIISPGKFYTVVIQWSKLVRHCMWSRFLCNSEDLWSP